MDAGTSTEGIPFFRVMLWGPFRTEKCIGEGYEPVKTADWGGSNYPRLLLKALLCCPGRRGRREALLEMLWPEIEVEQATANLNTATTKLRTLLRPAKGQESLLLTEDDATIYQLPGQGVLWVDSEAVHQDLDRAERLGRALVEMLPLLEDAISLSSRGTFLEGEEGRWAAEKRATRERERYRGRIWLAESYIQQGRVGQAETLLTTLLEDDPFDEDVLCRLMTLLRGQGMTHQALLLYQQARDLFTQEQIVLSEATQHFAACMEKERQPPLLRSSLKTDPMRDLAFLDARAPQSPPLYSRIHLPWSSSTAPRDIMKDERNNAEETGLMDYLRRQITFQGAKVALGLASFPSLSTDLLTRRLLLALTQQRSPDIATMHYLHQRVAHYWEQRQAAKLGPVLIPYVTEDLQRISTLLEGSLLTNLRTELTFIAGNLAMLLGELFYELNYYAEARKYVSSQKSGESDRERRLGNGKGRLLCPPRQKEGELRTKESQNSREARRTSRERVDCRVC